MYFIIKVRTQCHSVLTTKHLFHSLMYIFAAQRCYAKRNMLYGNSWILSVWPPSAMHPVNLLTVIIRDDTRVLFTYGYT